MPDLETIYLRQEGEPFLFSAENPRAQRAQAEPNPARQGRGAKAARRS